MSPQQFFVTLVAAAIYLCGTQTSRGVEPVAPAEVGLAVTINRLPATASGLIPTPPEDNLPTPSPATTENQPFDHYLEVAPRVFLSLERAPQILRINLKSMNKSGTDGGHDGR